MLVENKFNKNDIITIKLLTGEEVLARYVSHDAEKLSVSRASVVAPNPQGGLGIVPWMMSALPDTIDINMSTVVTFTDTAKEIANKFLEATTSIKLS